jgi:hypothetical protein
MKIFDKMKIYASFVVKEALSRRLVCEVTKDMLNPPQGILFVGLHANIAVGGG